MFRRNNLSQRPIRATAKLAVEWTTMQAVLHRVKRALLVSLVTLFASCGGGGGEAPGPVARLEVLPTAVLLNGAGQTQPLKVRAFDANGLEITNAPITFTSSQPAQVSVSSDGIVTAASPVGSAILSISSGSVSAAPLIAVAAGTVPGAVMVSNDQVVSGPQLVNGYTTGIGGRYTVVLKGIATPAPGTVMLASGGYPIAGKVVSTTGSGDALMVTLELVPIDELFDDLSVSITMSAEQLAQPNSAAGDRIKVLAATTRFLPCSKPSFDASLLDAKIDATLTYSLKSASFDIQRVNKVSKGFTLLASGTIEEGLSGTVAVFAATGTVDCARTFFKVPLALGVAGALAIVLGPEMTLALDFHADINATTNVTYGVSISQAADFTVGVKGDSAGLTNLSTFTPQTPKFESSPTFGNTAARVTLAGFAGIRIGLVMGSELGDTGNFFELTAGPELSNSWGTPYDAGRDPNFNSNYELKAKLSVGPGPALDDLLKKLKLVASFDFSYSADQTLGTSPTLSIARLNKNSFKAGDALSFTLKLDPASVTFPFGIGLYNVQEIRIYRLDDAGQAAAQVASATASDGQTDFTIPWVADADGAVDLARKPAFYAFVVPRILNILRTDFPIELGRVDGPSTDLRPAITTPPNNTIVSAGQSASFTVVASGTGPLSYQWRKNGANVTCATGNDCPSYTTPATTLPDNGALYSVVVSNLAGTATSTQASLTVVTAAASNLPPAASFSRLANGLSVSFDGSASSDSDGLVAGYAWTFGDGGTGSGKAASHSYASAGVYSVTLTVTDDKGATASTSQSITVSPLTPGQTAAITQVLDDVGASTGPLTQGATTDDTTPTLSGTLSAALSATQALRVYDGSTLLGGATVSGTNWSFTPSALANGSHSFSAVVSSIDGIEGNRSAAWGLTISAAANRPLQAPRMSVSGDSSCALTAAGGVKCWGENSNAQIGDGSTQRRSMPTDVVGLSSGVVAVSAGGTHTCALMAAGSVKCWGVNGLLRGDGTTQFRLTPADVVGLSSGVVAVSAGGDHSCALTTNGGVKCWGINDKGQLGDGTTQNQPTPVDVVTLGSGAVAVSVGPGHSCALTLAGIIKCWGNNALGQLGDGTTQNRLTPVDVTGLSSGAVAVSVGTDHSCAITVAGGVKCWGVNTTGELGDGTTQNRLTPVDVAGLSSGVAAVSAGSGAVAGGPHTCALINAGGVKCWGGLNQFGELGDGTTQIRLTPVDVVGLSSGVAAVSAGGGHSCALMNAGGAKCWGHNNQGQLGNGIAGDRLTPVDVVGL